jgi:putative PIN family toxin of toxin-antitoxin system
MATATGNISLPEPLLAEIRNAARAEHRSADEVVADAVRVYLEKQSWGQFVERNERRAKEMGITEDDVDRLITEYRAENRQHGRWVLRVTADTNILISALIFRGGKPFQLLELAREGKISLAVSDAILDEVGGVLARKFNWPPEDIADARKRIIVIARTVKPAVQLDVIKEDPPDNRILECAVGAGSDYIVSGDKDLLRLGGYDSIKILSVSDFLSLAPEQTRAQPS